MNRKLATAIGAILVGGMTTAQADVTMFGHLDLSLNYIDGSSSPYVSRGDEDTRFECTTCSIGFKGSEDLGNGLKAVFKLDFQFDMDERNARGANNDSGAITDRDQWLGLAGNFGSIKVGTISTTYKSTGAKLDPGYRTIAQMRDIGIQSALHSGAGSNGQGRAENTARYDSPSWNGLKFNAHYTLSKDGQTTKGQVANDNGWGAGVSYENGGLLVFGNYITNGADGDAEAYKAGAKFTFNNFSVFGQYEVDAGMITDRYNGTLGADTDGDGADIWMAGGSYSFGNNMIYAAYGQGDGTDATASDLGVASKDDANGFIADDHVSFEIVGIHMLSKRTLAYAGYVNVDFDASGWDDIDHYTMGMKHKF